MNKIWYIFSDDHHKGPFSSREIVEMYESGLVSGQIMIWKEGAPEWTPLYKCEYFSDALVFPSSFEDQEPKIPVFVPVVREKRVVSTSVETGPSLIPDVSFLWKKCLKVLRKVLVFGVPCLVFLFLVHHFTKQEKIDLTGISKREFNRIKKVVRAGTDQSVQMSFSMAKNGKEIVVATNIKGSGVANLKLESLEDRVVTDEKITIISKGKLYNHVIRFKELTVKEGNKIARGHYMAIVEGVDTSFFAKCCLYLKKTGMFDFMDFIKDFSNKFNYRGVFLLSREKPDVFEKKLSVYVEKQRKKEVAPFQNLLEKYITFSALLKKMGRIYELNLMKAKRTDSSFSGFKKQYARSVAPVLQRIIVDGDKVHVSPMQIIPEVTEENDKMILFGRRIGELASDMVVDTLKNKRLDKRVKDRLLKKFKKRVLSLGEVIQIRINRLQNILSKIKS